MLHQKNIPIQEYEKSTEKSEYECLYKMDGDIKGDNNTDENEGIVEYGKIILNCEIIFSKQWKNYSNLCHLKLQKAILHRHFFQKTFSKSWIFSNSLQW